MAERRRRRVVGERAGAEQSGAARPEAPATRPDGARSGRSKPSPASAPDDPALWVGSELDPATAERGLRGLVGGGSSQVSPAAALRARDAARPSPQELAQVEAELRIVRRNWTPRD